jgi:MFS-type transporter involved in bile tolerance (Atg22 family)
VSGILSSFLLPFVGAIIDYTPNRHLVGVVSSAILVAIQAIQIYTVESTWFPMSILQAINGFIYQVVALASYAYLPEIVSSIDEKTFQWYSSLYYMAMFGHEILFLIVMAAIAVILGTDDVVTAQISQGLDTVVTGGYFILTWYYFTKKEAKAILSKDSTLCGAGFRQVFRTSTGLYHHYPNTVGRFFVGCIFAEAGE